MAMVFMFCDHLWVTGLCGNKWLTCVGRIAFPIFAFMIVEGYFHTHNLKKYVLRLLLLALLSELPFNLMLSGSLIYPFHQNVIWTFLISILLIWMNEKAKATGIQWKQSLTAFGILILGFLIGLVSFADYGFCGVFMVLAFYFFRGKSPQCLFGQFLSMVCINMVLLGGYKAAITLGSFSVSFPQQGFAVLALIPIWLYQGKQGPHGKVVQYLNYSFYPVHMLLLALIQMFR